MKSPTDVLGERELSDAVLMRVIASIVLLTAINYKGIEDGPSFEFVLAIGSESDFADLMANAGKGNLTEEDRRTARWRLLLDELNIWSLRRIRGSGNVQFLVIGQFDASKIITIVRSLCPLKPIRQRARKGTANS